MATSANKLLVEWGDDMEWRGSATKRITQRDLIHLSPAFSWSKAPFPSKLSPHASLDESTVQTGVACEKNDGPSPVDVTSLQVLVLFQRTRSSMAEVGPDVVREKDEKLEKFLEKGGLVCQRLRAMGYWCDLVDPCSGFLMDTPNGPSPLSDLDLLSQMFALPVERAGPCLLLEHPRWKSCHYPAIILTTAPAVAQTRVLQEELRPPPSP